MHYCFQTFLKLLKSFALFLALRQRIVSVFQVVAGTIGIMMPTYICGVILPHMICGVITPTQDYVTS